VQRKLDALFIQIWLMRSKAWPLTTVLSFYSPHCPDLMVPSSWQPTQGLETSFTDKARGSVSGRDAC
jgi:hypothetical protein